MIRMQAKILALLTALACLSTVYSFGLLPVHRTARSSGRRAGSSSSSKSSFSPHIMDLPRASSRQGMLLMGGEESKDQIKAKREVRGWWFSARRGRWLTSSSFLGAPVVVPSRPNDQPFLQLTQNLVDYQITSEHLSALIVGRVSRVGVFFIPEVPVGVPDM